MQKKRPRHDLVVVYDYKVPLYKNEEPFPSSRITTAASTFSTVKDEV